MGRDQDKSERELEEEVGEMYLASSCISHFESDFPLPIGSRTNVPRTSLESVSRCDRRREPDVEIPQRRGFSTSNHAYQHTGSETERRKAV